jgi:hypothetical protein
MASDTSKDEEAPLRDPHDGNPVAESGCGVRRFPSHGCAGPSR